MIHVDDRYLRFSQALHSVASVFLDGEELPADLRPGIVEHMVMVHQSVRTFSQRFQVSLK
jgi:dynein heavy chain, axonemal